MGIITEIKLQSRNKKRVSIFVDDKFVTGMESIVCATFGLKVGDTVSESEILAMSEESNRREAFDKAIALLAKGMRTEKEVRDNLKKKGYPDSAIDSAVSQLHEYKYLDDRAYVKAYLSCYGNDRGSMRIKSDLLAKGVDKQLLEEFLSELDGQEDAAKRAAEKYVKTHPQCDKAKLSRHLYSKGFDYSAISYAVDMVLSGGDDFYE